MALMPPSPDRRGFSLVEMLVVVALIIALLGILLPVLSDAEEQGRSLLCLNRQREIHRATKMFAHANRNLLPYTAYDADGSGGNDQSYSDQILPYMLPGAGDTDGDLLVDAKWYEDLDYFRCPSERDLKPSSLKAWNGQQLDFGMNNYGRKDNSNWWKRRFHATMSGINLNDVKNPRVLYYIDSKGDDPSHPETIGGKTRDVGALEWPIRWAFEESYLRHRYGYNAVSLDGSGQWYSGRVPNHRDWWIERMIDKWWSSGGGNDANYNDKTKEFQDDLDRLKNKYNN